MCVFGCLKNPRPDWSFFQGKISALLVAVKQELPPTGSQVLCRGAAFPATSCPQGREGNRKSHPFTSRMGFVSNSPRYDWRMRQGGRRKWEGEVTVQPTRSVFIWKTYLRSPWQGRGGPALLHSVPWPGSRASRSGEHQPALPGRPRLRLGPHEETVCHATGTAQLHTSVTPGGPCILLGYKR